jgi:GTP-binding protein
MSDAAADAAVSAPPLRNVAIIAHVDHGKTTLLDGLLASAGTFREHQQVDERVMDRLALEKERGITIQAKNCSFTWKDVKINVLDTPGHADFGGEVERALYMVDAALLMVDAAEGPMPQTRFVVRKALERGLKILVCINKVDRKDADPHRAHDLVFDLLAELGAEDWQLDFPCIFASAVNKLAYEQPESEPGDLSLILDMLLEHVPPPQVGGDDEPLQLLVSDLARSDFLGRLAVGRIARGRIKVNQDVTIIDASGIPEVARVTKLFAFRGLEQEPVETASAGEIVQVAGCGRAGIGDTLTHPETPEALPRLEVEEPVIALEFLANTSPLSGRSGAKFLTARHIRDRLEREALGNPSIRIEAGTGESMRVSGRGELQLSVLIETMRREGFELAVSRPEVILHQDEHGRQLEPYEKVTVDAPEDLIGSLTEFFSKRRGRMLSLDTPGGGRARMEFRIPSRGLIGLRTKFRVITRGDGIMASELDGWEKLGDEIAPREGGALVADRTGKTTKYALFNLEDRGVFFVPPRVDVYEGMIVGENARAKDLWVNICREKQLTNVRSSGADDAALIQPHKEMTLEECLEFLAEDELCEVTPDAYRIRKRVLRKP